MTCYDCSRKAAGWFPDVSTKVEVHSTKTSCVMIGYPLYTVVCTMINFITQDYFSVNLLMT